MASRLSLPRPALFFVIAGSALSPALAERAGHQVVALQAMQSGPTQVPALTVWLATTAPDLAPIPLFVAVPGASQTLTVAVPDPKEAQVIPRQGVPFGTVGPGCVAGTDTLSPQHVLALAGWPTMPRITAPAPAVIADVMVQPKASGDRPDFALVAKPVDQVALVVNRDLPVSVVVLASGPDVASLFVLNPAERRLDAVPRGEVPGHLARRFRYFRMYFALYTRRHLEHRPSEARFPASLWPRLQYMAFMPSKVTRLGVTDNGE